MPLVYLAGPIAGLTFGHANEWRLHAERRLEDFAAPGGLKPIATLSPLRGKNTLIGADHLCGADLRGNTEPKLTERGVFGRDMNDVRRADAILANFQDANRVSIGTVFELGVAYSLNKPIVVVLPPMNLLAIGDDVDKEKLHDHAFLRQAAVYTVYDLDEGIDLIASLMGFSV